MANVWSLAALWIGLALVATLLAIWFRVSTALSEIVVGKVLEQIPHPKSRNPLWVHQVDLGDRVEQIIAGAPNAIPGSLVPVALPGTTVPNGKLVKDLNIAGYKASGMLCSGTHCR